MASVSRDANGTKRVLFTDGAGRRRAIRLGDVPVKAAEAFRLRVEALNAARITGTSWDTELAGWVRDLPDSMRARLGRAGLVDASPGTLDATLGGLLDTFSETTKVKPATAAAYKQGLDSLANFFGRER